MARPRQAPPQPPPDWWDKWFPRLTEVLTEVGSWALGAFMVIWSTVWAGSVRLPVLLIGSALIGSRVSKHLLRILDRILGNGEK